MDSGFKHISQPLGADIYNGAAGNALFLAHAYELIPDRVFRHTAVAAARYALNEAPSIPALLRMSFYSGWIGIGFAAMVVGNRLGDRACSRDGRRLVRRAADLDPGRHPTDQFLGSASAIAPLLAIDRALGDEWALTAAAKIADALLDMSRVRGSTRSWAPSGPMNNLHRDDLTGFAHGACGVAWALLEVGEATNAPELREAAREGFAYERRWYRPEQKNWLDLRYMAGPDGDTNDGRTCQIQWCHGAAGIGLTRLRAYELLGDVQCRDEALAALSTVVDDRERWPRNWQPGFSLCHGVAGNGDFLIEAGRVLQSQTWRSAALASAELGIEQYASPNLPWPSALGPTEIPALMTGAGGTGLFYLRLVAPDRIPSLLLPWALHLSLA